MWLKAAVAFTSRAVLKQQLHESCKHTAASMAAEAGSAGDSGTRVRSEASGPVAASGAGGGVPSPDGADAVADGAAAPPLPKRAAGTVRLVLVSDTHAHHRELGILPDGDALIHAGDFTTFGRAGQLERFNTWLGRQPHKTKLVVLGNHERRPLAIRIGMDAVHEGLSNATLLDGESTARAKISNGDAEIAVHGIPWFPDRDDEVEQLKGVDLEGVDVLVTHNPPDGWGDASNGGSEPLRERIVSEASRGSADERRLRLSVCGHIHEGRGAFAPPEFGGRLLVVNAAVCGGGRMTRQVAHGCIVVDIPASSDGAPRVVAGADVAVGGAGGETAPI